MNPELRQTLQHITRNIENANEVAQENIYTFTQLYIDPCLAGLKSCIHECTAPCFPNREDQLRRKRGRSQGQTEFDFNFYDDWNEDELGAFGWGNDELDSLLAGRGPSQPRRQRAMSYGARRRRDEAESDPNVIPKSSYLGFLERLPFKLGSGGVKYKPSAANLLENPGGLRIRDVEAAAPLLESDADADTRGRYHKGHSRQRSGTEASRSTMTSRSSRGDLIMSDEEDDAVPLDDEFAANMLLRRPTEENINNKARRSIGASRVSSRTVSTPSTKSQDSPRLSNKTLPKSAEITPEDGEDDADQYEPPSLVDLKQAEEQLRQQEELEIAQKREAAQKLAQSMGLSTDARAPSLNVKSDHGDRTPMKSPIRTTTDTSYFALSSPISPIGETEPFPNFESPRTPTSPMSMRERQSDPPP